MMKTFRIIVPLLLLMFAFSCKNEKVDMQQFVAERDSILQDNRSKTQQLDELNGVLNTIATGLDSIAVQENILSIVVGVMACILTNMRLPSDSMEWQISWLVKERRFKFCKIL